MHELTKMRSSVTVGWCADPLCGCANTYDTKTKTLKSSDEIKTYCYYRCSNGRKIQARLTTVQEDAIMNQLSRSIEAISIREDFRIELLRSVNETLVRARRAVKDDFERYEAALIALKEKSDRADDKFDSGEIDRETYNEQCKKIQNEQSSFTSMMKTAQLAIGEKSGETVESIIELASNAESL